MNSVEQFEDRFVKWASNTARNVYQAEDIINDLLKHIQMAKCNLKSSLEYRAMLEAQLSKFPKTYTDFGFMIEVSHKLKRIKKTAVERIWEKEEIKPTQVMVIGQRTLSNGKVHVDYGDGYYETYFEGKEYFQAYLVVENIKSKPFFVTLERI